MKLPGLVKVLAEGDERGEATLNHIARMIREAGHLPTTKRGPGASDMGVREAANLLIAVSGSDVPTNAAAAIEQYRSLQFSRSERERGFDLGQSGWWTKIKSASNFSEALQHLISLTADDREEILREFATHLGYDDERHLYRSVTFSRPEPRATITLHISNLADLEETDRATREARSVRFTCVFVWDGETPLLQPFRSDAKGRLVEVTIQEHTLRLLTEACAGRGHTSEAPNEAAA